MARVSMDLVFSLVIVSMDLLENFVKLKLMNVSLVPAVKMECV